MTNEELDAKLADLDRDNFGKDRAPFVLIDTMELRRMLRELKKLNNLLSDISHLQQEAKRLYEDYVVGHR